jgi:hypothetical protein
MVDSVKVSHKTVWSKFIPYVVLIVLEIFIDVSECVSRGEVDRHLELGKQYLAKGQLGDALSHYHSAVGNYVITL